MASYVAFASAIYGVNRTLCLRTILPSLLLAYFMVADHTAKFMIEDPRHKHLSVSPMTFISVNDLYISHARSR